jgi:hypothetical protein
MRGASIPAGGAAGPNTWMDSPDCKEGILQRRRFATDGSGTSSLIQARSS